VDASGTTTYAWDYENRLTQVKLPGSGGTVSFTYDPLGRRVRKIAPTSTTVFAYDGANIIEETDSSGNAVARYAMGLNIDEPLAMLRSSATHFYDADGLGSITSLTDSSGAASAAYRYDTFGNLASSTGSVMNPFRYTAREDDAETNLYYYRARYYEQRSGRFLSEDPLRFGVGTNFFVYTFNQPTQFMDPLGLSPGDVKRIQEACKKCTDELTQKGERRAGSGTLNGMLNNIISSFTLGEKYSGCDRQANLAASCLSTPSPPYDDKWEFTVVTVELGTHRLVQGISKNPLDPIVHCDPWRNTSSTTPRDEGKTKGGGQK
jgi:RHS repeat-associated protein